ncbi:hypothetical protein TRV_01015 [Trichophyton verrucosum HKI 0517]|uniref:Uncharacterized protein n=1 Tax=Trichophyton verrucosum (strain HKI 0517) TaxID=663202 RepID=D4D1N3_TRIVH|nr:uncharacterized protein TRV_01015 [Trichophyton verrucosum HKI 0517]EFE44239.1 hypothetical protein TRV_01015 [Trichophyton verrucosum HKI 0517]
MAKAGQKAKAKAQAKAKATATSLMFVCLLSLSRAAVEAEGRRLISSLGTSRGPGVSFSFLGGLQLRLQPPSTSTSITAQSSVDDQLRQLTS